MRDRQQLHDILVEGRFDRRRVTVRHVRKGVSLSKEQEQYIREQWQQFVKNQVASNSELTLHPYSGELFRLLDFRVSDSMLQMSLGEVSFDQYVVSKMVEFIERFGDVKAIPVAVVAVVGTSDDCIVLGEGRLGTEEIGIVAGFMEREDPDTREELSPHPFDQMERELTEEAGVYADDIQAMTCLGILGHVEPYVVFDVKLRIPFRILVHERTPQDLEFTRFFPIGSDPDSLSSYVLDKEAIMALHCLSSLLLWGKCAFGRNWFETLVGQLGSKRR